MKKIFTYVIEQDEDGMYVANVPELPGCHTQSQSLNQLEERIKEVIKLYLIERIDTIPDVHIIGTKQIEIQIQ